jgi:hypothetical protein
LIRRGALALMGPLMLACGVPGLPLPPGPIPPAAPSDVRVLSTPDGLEISAVHPTHDIDGSLLEATPSLQVFVDDPRCHGTAVATAADGPLRWSVKPNAAVQLRVTAALADRRGPPAPPVFALWTPPPPAPDAPIGFATPHNAVQIAWLPPEGQGGEMLILRDGAVIGRAAIAAAGFIDPAPAGARRYTLKIETPIARSGPSPAVVVAP